MDQKQQPRRQRRGNYSMLMGVMSLVVVGFGALAVDVSLITMAELQTQATADAASHAALIVYRENSDPSDSNIGQAEGNGAAGWILSHNKIAMGHAFMDSGYPEYGQWDYAVLPAGAFQHPIGPGEAVNAVQVSISRTGANAVDMLLAPMFGYNKRDVRATSITAQQNRAVMLIQDMSGSMMSTIPGDTNSAIEHSRKAQRAFVQYIADRPQAGDMIGLAMFAQMGAVEPTGANPWGTKCGGSYNCTGTGGRPMGTKVPWLPLQPIDSADVFPRVDGICDTHVGLAGDPCVITGQPTPHIEPVLNSGGYYWNDVGGCTNPEIAMLQAIDELLTKTDSTYFRAIVLMSDGVPNCDVNMNFDEPDAMGRALNAADIAAANGIRIYTALYHNGYFNSDFMTSEDPGVGLVRNGGFGLVSPNAADLSTMLVQIAKSFPTAFMD